MMDGNTSPLSSPDFHSFENLAHCYEEREKDGVILLLWVTGWVAGCLGGLSPEESKQTGEVR